MACHLAVQAATGWRRDLAPYLTSCAEIYGFSSERKMASVLVKRKAGTVLRLYNKVHGRSMHGRAACAVGPCVALAPRSLL